MTEWYDIKNLYKCQEAFKGGLTLQKKKNDMLSYIEEPKKCPNCGRMVKYCTADTPAVRRTYCPICLQDIEVMFKGRDAF